jgi:thioredoxin-like negative regulator of GroEL
MGQTQCRGRVAKFGFADKPQPAPGLIQDTTEASFLADAIEASQTVPVIVDVFAFSSREPMPIPAFAGTCFA